jgi:glycine cleavage system aminomethyltransferase T
MGVGQQQRKAYEALLAASDSPFVAQRPPLFSPAVAAQDTANVAGAYGHFAQLMLPLHYTDWAEETRAHVRTCYLGDWTPLNKIIIRGRQAREFLSGLSPANLSVFELGQIKHHVQLDGHGWVASEGVLCRLGEEEFLYTAGSGDWLAWRFRQGSWDAEIADVSPDQFIFGVQGPSSLAVLETATGESLRDIGFNRSRAAHLAGIRVRVLRTGISGELGYELHGPSDDANEVWSAVAKAGEGSGLRLLGFGSQSVQHIEAGIATNGLDYMPSASITPGAPTQFRQRPIGGSFVPSAFTDYFRKPRELGWGPRKELPAHDFLGRDALAADLAAGFPGRQRVGLVWNPADVVAVFASLFGDQDPAEQMHLPRFNGPSFDQILAGGEMVGVSTGRALSVNLRSTISLGVVDPRFTTAGTELTVLWGRPGTAQREIRATVTALPFKPDRRRTDVNALGLDPGR